MSPEPGLYVHVPFCSALCPYCDFAVNVSSDRSRRARFAKLLAAEIEMRGRPERTFDTLYFGGGTPSELAADELDSIVEALDGGGWLQSNAAFYLEANPESVTSAASSRLRRTGIGTLSLGVQSFDSESLRFLGRRHSPRQARLAVEWAREAGFDTVSIDLMYGLPGQTEDRWRRDLETAIELGTDHLSCYQLTIHDRTIFGKRRRQGNLVEASGDSQAALFRLTHRVLEDAGYEGYEVSNFARSRGHRSRHNEKYWTHVPYLGLGPAAHSFDGRSRSWNERSFFAWGRAIERGELPQEGREALTDEALLLETVMLRLRTREGLDLDSVRERFGVSLLDSNRVLIGTAIEERLLVLDGAMLRPTLDGLAVADGLAGRFRLATDSCPQPLPTR
jgi:putative oxygen-independent coproporphyrinogen III oxidase